MFMKVLLQASSLLQDKRKVFTDALKNNLPTFVDEFIKLGIDPSEVFMETEVLTQGHLADCSNGHAGRYRLFINELYSDDAVVRC